MACYSWYEADLRINVKGRTIYGIQQWLGVDALVNIIIIIIIIIILLFLLSAF